MNAYKIGAFIQSLRKEMGLTQKELAQALNISDKAVSKWETGNGMPDVSLFIPLCKILKININELLSGERLQEEDYSKNAEENMLNLLQEKHMLNRRSIASICAGTVLLLSGIALQFIFTGINFAWYLDIPSLLIPTCLCTAIVLISGKNSRLEIIRLLRKAVIPVGMSVSIAVLMSMVASLGDFSAMGSKLAVSILSVFYSLIAYIVLLILEQRVK